MLQCTGKLTEEMTGVTLYAQNPPSHHTRLHCVVVQTRHKHTHTHTHTHTKTHTHKYSACWVIKERIFYQFPHLKKSHHGIYSTNKSPTLAMQLGTKGQKHLDNYAKISSPQSSLCQECIHRTQRQTALPGEVTRVAESAYYKATKNQEKG
jgi:hypothetical protein